MTRNVGRTRGRRAIQSSSRARTKIVRPRRTEPAIMSPASPERTRMPPTSGAPRVLVIVQNLPVPLDRRVWLECRALIDAGYEVSVICPRGDRPEDRARREVLDGVHIYRYRSAPQSRGVLGFFYEF